jgi:cytochrome c
MRVLRPLFALGIILTTLQCKHSSHEVSIARPNDPWVFRSVMDKQPRMISFALHDSLWVSYSTDSCALYKAWAGSVAFEGAVYNMRHGPQPTSMGNAWFENKFRQPWTVSINGRTEVPRTDYKGHRYTKGSHAEIMYDLVLQSGQRIRVNESPEYIFKGAQRGFERTFTLEQVPAGATVVLHTNAASLAASNSIETNGAWKVLNQDNSNNSLSVEGELTLSGAEKTRFTTWFVPTPQIPNPFDLQRQAEAEGKDASPGERLMAKSDCRTCHNPKVRTVGPSYVSIAEKYKTTPGNIERLAQKVISGGSGVWGAAAMSAHPAISTDDAKTLVSYILSMDEGEDDGEGGAAVVKNLAEIPESKWLKSGKVADEHDLRSGLLVNLYRLNKMPHTFADVHFSGKPALTAVAGTIDVDDFGPFKEQFGFEATGYLFLEKDDNILLQLASDDGGRLYLDNQLLIDNDGWHGMDPKEAEVAIRAGYHALRLEYFQAGGGRGITLKWARSGDSELRIIPEANFARELSKTPAGATFLATEKTPVPGDGAPLISVHPAYDLSQARPDDFKPKVAGMDFLPDGRMVVSTWDANGAVYLLEGMQTGDPTKIKVKRIAQGLAEPLGLKVVDGAIYVLQKQELTKLVDTNGDDIIDEYQCFAKGWRASANFHEFAFGLVYKDGYFYATLATAIMPGGASARPQIPDRGKVVRISMKDGSVDFVARGLRTPNGIGIGPDGEIFVADNQGDWLPSSKILHVKPGAFFGSYSVDSMAVAQMPVQPPVVWEPQDEISNSPTQPAILNDGPYKGQLIHGDVCYGGLQRIFMEKIKGDYQGCVFKFTQGLEAGTNRLAWGPDGALYVGGIGNPGNWGQQGKFWYGLQRMKYNGQSVFEMLALRAKSDGIEIEFTEPLRQQDGWDPAQFAVKQWWYKPTNQYGGPKMDEQTMPVSSASVSADRKKVFLEIPGLKPGHVVYIQLRNLPLSDAGHELWTTDAWYTLNNIPDNSPGEKHPRPAAIAATPDNTLSESEKSQGWALLFDGKTSEGWHNYGKTTVGKSWVADDNALHLDAKHNPSGHWQAPDGGDILTAAEYQDFEMELDWKIGSCGNSGIIYNIVEDPARYDYVWKTGMEMQVLDNTCHPDSRFPKHRAGDLYDLIECRFVAVKPAGSWNHVRIVSKNGKIEQWLNYHKMVSYDITGPEWPKLIAGSKFREFPDFGKSRKGRIALQDHGDPVWYKNIKIRRL